MKKNLFYSCFLAMAVLLPQQVFPQKKHYILNVKQPPEEECTTGTPAAVLQSQVKIFPNPTTGELTVSFGAACFNSSYVIRVFSMDGKLLQLSEVFPVQSDPGKKLDLSAMTRGIYLLRIYGKDVLLNERIILY